MSAVCLSLSVFFFFLNSRGNKNFQLGIGRSIAHFSSSREGEKEKKSGVARVTRERMIYDERETLNETLTRVERRSLPAHDHGPTTTP